MVYRGCLPAAARSGELGIPSSDSPAFSMAWGLPGWPCSYFNPLLSPTENDPIVQGNWLCALATSSSQCSTFPPPSVLWEGDATWQKTLVLITMQCICQMPSVVSRSLQHGSDSAISQLSKRALSRACRELSSSCRKTYSFIFHPLLIKSTLFPPTGFIQVFF